MNEYVKRAYEGLNKLETAKKYDRPAVIDLYGDAAISEDVQQMSVGQIRTLSSRSEKTEDAFDNADLLGQLSTAATPEAIEIWDGFLKRLKTNAENDDGDAQHFSKVLEGVLQNSRASNQDQRRNIIVKTVLNEISSDGEMSRVIEEALEQAIKEVMQNTIMADYKPQFNEFLSAIPEFRDNPQLFNPERNIIIQSKYPHDELFVRRGRDRSDNPNLNVSVYYKTAIRWFLDQGGYTAMFYALGHELAEGYAGYFGWNGVKMPIKEVGGKGVNVAHDIVVREGFPHALDDPSGVFGKLYAEARKNKRTPFIEIQERFKNAVAALKEEAQKQPSVSFFGGNPVVDMLAANQQAQSKVFNALGLPNVANHAGFSAALNPFLASFDGMNKVLNAAASVLGFERTTSAQSALGANYGAFQNAMNAFPFGENVTNHFISGGKNFAGSEHFITFTRDGAGNMNVFWHEKAIQNILQGVPQGNIEAQFFSVLFHEYGESILGLSHQNMVDLGFGANSAAGYNELVSRANALQTAYQAASMSRARSWKNRK